MRLAFTNLRSHPRAQGPIAFGQSVALANCGTSSYATTGSTLFPLHWQPGSAATAFTASPRAMEVGGGVKPSVVQRDSRKVKGTKATGRGKLSRAAKASVGRAKSTREESQAKVLQQTQEDMEATPRQWEQVHQLSVSSENESTKALFQGYKLHTERKDYTSAEQAYKKSIQLNPKNTEALYSYSMLAFNCLKEPQKALSLIQKAVRLCPKEAKYLDRYATTLWKEAASAASRTTARQTGADKELNKEETLLEDGTGRDYPKITESWGNAMCMRAEENHRLAVKLDPGNPKLLTNYADFTLLVKKDLAEAEKMYTSALSLDDSFLAAMKGLALIHQHNKKYSKAEQVYQKAIRATKEADPMLLYSYSLFLRAEEEANKYLNKAYEGDPENEDILFEKAHQIHLKGMNQEVSTKGSARVDKYSIAGGNTGLVSPSQLKVSPETRDIREESEGTVEPREGVEAMYQKVLAKNPDHEPCLAAYGMYLEHSGEMDKAESIYERLVQRYSSGDPFGSPEDTKESLLQLISVGETEADTENPKEEEEEDFPRGTRNNMSEGYALETYARFLMEVRNADGKNQTAADKAMNLLLQAEKFYKENGLWAKRQEVKQTALNLYEAQATPEDRKRIAKLKKYDEKYNIFEPVHGESEGRSVSSFFKF